MSDAPVRQTLSKEIWHMLGEGHKREDIVTELVAKGHEEYYVKELLEETVKLRAVQSRSQALVLILIGAVICFTSFLLTITSTFTHSSFSIVLYGLTTVGIVFVFAGFMKIF
jgi:hypothetical protein